MKSLTLPNAIFIGSLFRLLQEGKVVTFTVKGNSMYPFLRNGRDLVKMKKPESDEMTSGRIVLFRYEGRYLLHRIIKKKGAGYYLRGDNNWSFHLEACREEDIRGMVVGVKRNGQEMDCHSWRWRSLSFLWMKTHAARVYLYRFYRCVRNLKYKLK